MVDGSQRRAGRRVGADNNRCGRTRGVLRVRMAVAHPADVTRLEPAVRRVLPDDQHTDCG